MKLSEIRITLNKSPKEMSKRLGVSLSLYYKLERGDTPIQASTQLLLDMIVKYEIGPLSSFIRYADHLEESNRALAKKVDILIKAKFDREEKEIIAKKGKKSKTG